MRFAMAMVSLVLLSGCIPSVEPARPQRYEPMRVDPQDSAVAPQRPTWEMRRVTAQAQQVETTRYTVRSGDSLRLIAVKTGAGSEAIARANNIGKPYIIHPGQVLTIPGGRYHLVREGETGIGIAQAYGADWSRIVSMNDLEEPYILRAGQRILIPDDGPESIEDRAARFHIDIDDIVTGGQPALASRGQPAAPSSSAKSAPSNTRAVAVPSSFAGGFRWPVDGSVVKRFGPGASGEKNEGIKIAVPLDTPILAAADGVVSYAGSDIAQMGGLVILSHGDGWSTVYGHAGQLLVRRGQSVKKGQMIALSGNSGYADRPELHFGVLQGRTPVDPLARLPRR